MPDALEVLDLAGIFVFAITGALVGVRKQLDVFGVQVLALVTGLGGGFIRDLLIGAVPPASLMDWPYLVVPIVAGLLTFFLHPGLERVERLVNVFDAAGLGLLCHGCAEGVGLRARAVAGRAARDDHRDRRQRDPRRPVRPGPGGAAAGALRDARVPRCCAGGRCPRGGAGRHWVAFVGAAMCFVIRMLAVRRGWNAPRPRTT